MMRWLVFHLPDLACAMIAAVLGFPVVLGGRTRFRGLRDGPAEKVVEGFHFFGGVEQRPGHLARRRTSCDCARGAHTFYEEG